MNLQKSIKFSLIQFLYFALLSLIIQDAVCTVSNEEKTAEHWRSEGQKALRSALRKRHNNNVAKNVILFLGDGMSLATVTAMRIYKGQKKGKSGEEEVLTFDEFPFTALSKTYGLDRQTSDSANTATAFLCGVKANYETIGLDGRGLRLDCNSSLDRSTHIPSILQWAQEAGKRTGFVTSTRVTHATPAGLYAHIASRDWEHYSPDDRCEDIAKQLVRRKPGQDIHVILGGGKGGFLPQGTDGGFRKDNVNLLHEWLTTKQGRNQKAEVVTDRESFLKLDLSKVNYLLGLFDVDHLPYVADRPDLDIQPPNLVELTETAIKLLSNKKDGFFLMVEGGKIDSAHHQNWGLKALEEGVEFDLAIEAAQRLTNAEDTLIVVTADHAHTFHIGGYHPMRGTNILGIGGVSDMDHFTYTILSYSKGLGYKGVRTKNVTESETSNKDYRQNSVFPTNKTGHGAEDVAIYAKGPMAHLFGGVHDQSYIPYVMGYAACIGPNKDHCSAGRTLNIPLYHTIMFCILLVFISTKYCK